MNRLARTVGSSTHLSMSRTFRMIQLNVRKQGPVHDSLMNDNEIQNATVLAIQEPWARRIQGQTLTTPMCHHKWTKMVPSTWREGRWAIRSMLWVNKEVEAEQVPIESPDVTAAIIRLPVDWFWWRQFTYQERIPKLCGTRATTYTKPFRRRGEMQAWWWRW